MNSRKRQNDRIMKEELRHQGQILEEKPVEEEIAEEVFAK